MLLAIYFSWRSSLCFLLRCWNKGHAKALAQHKLMNFLEWVIMHFLWAMTAKVWAKESGYEFCERHGLRCIRFNVAMTTLEFYWQHICRSFSSSSRGCCVWCTYFCRVSFASQFVSFRLERNASSPLTFFPWYTENEVSLHPICCHPEPILGLDTRLTTLPIWECGNCWKKLSYCTKFTRLCWTTVPVITSKSPLLMQDSLGDLQYFDFSCWEVYLVHFC